MGGKDIMVDYKKSQEDGFRQLNEILQQKGVTETIQEYIKRLETMFYFYIIVDLDWEVVLQKVHGLSGDELEKFLAQFVKIVEDYSE